MKLDQLMKYWEKEFAGQLNETGYQIKLSVEDAARLEALSEMFPKYPQENLLRDLISSALNEVTNSFPYVAGKEVVARDEEGDPLYADIGQTPKFLNLTRKHLKQINDAKKASAH
jgi:predicted DNA-binding protein